MGLRALLAAPGILQAPGVYDGLSALLVERAGFPVMFLSGAGLAYTRFGRPDLGLVTMSELVETVAVISERIGLPMIVDGDTGFGNALNLKRTVQRLEQAGAAAIQFEDQLAPKRCGHMQGKQVVSTGEMLGRVRAALDARRNEDTLVIARTDALALEGLDAALDRAEAYLEAGADLLFIEGPRTLEEMQQIAGRFAGRVPLVHNLVEGGGSPLRDAAALEALGFGVALHPSLLVHLFTRQAPRYLARLAAEGGTDGFADELLDLQEINAVLGAEGLLADAARYA
ncbi:MAG: isocitrate lyase/PEP mutase family protein [Gammaproteobacteria bacterium]|nr:isocitrate lyase/PEP mutase family protein [Gammaproteobacteria bacterium]